MKTKIKILASIILLAIFFGVYAQKSIEIEKANYGFDFVQLYYQ